MYVCLICIFKKKIGFTVKIWESVRYRQEYVNFSVEQSLHILAWHKDKKFPDCYCALNDHPTQNACHWYVPLPINKLTSQCEIRTL